MSLTTNESSILEIGKKNKTDVKLQPNLIVYGEEFKICNT